MIVVALKEWAVVCDLLLEGRLVMLMRKGGIHERGGPGVFELEHPRFALFPSWAHQQPGMIKDRYRQGVSVLQEPATLTLRGVAEVPRIWQVADRADIEPLDDLHCWTADHLDMRFNYRPERPLYVLAVRTFLLAEPKTITNTPDYAGCRSWVPLSEQDAVDDAAAMPVLPDASFHSLIERIDAVLGKSG